MILKTIFFIIFLLVSPSWADNFNLSREKKVDSYLEEFSSGVLKDKYTNIYQAIRKALILLPEPVFRKATDRRFPVVFLEVPHYGVSPWADSVSISQDPRDPIAFSKGIWIIQLNIALDKAKDTEAIEGIIFHEIAHKVLGHQGDVFNMEVEKQANREVKKWGFTRQFEKAKAEFGTQKAP